MDLSWDHFNSRLQAYVLKNSNLAINTSPLKPTKLETSFRKLPTKLGMLFPAQLQTRDRELCSQTYLSLALEWSQVTHIPASIRMGGAYKPKSRVPLPDCVMTLVFQDGSLPFHHTHKHSSPFQQDLHTQMVNHHIQQARKSFQYFFEPKWKDNGDWGESSNCTFVAFHSFIHCYIFFFPLGV